jgi:Phosphotransferase enzyme family
VPADDAVEVAVAPTLGPVEVLERSPYPYATSFPLEQIRLLLADGREMCLIAKELGRAALSEPARRAKPEHLYDPLREIEVYTHVLVGHELGTARCFGTVVDPGRDRYRIYLEQVDGVELWQIGELDVWEQAARALARLHDEVKPLGGAHLLRFDEAFFHQWPERAWAHSRGPGLARIKSRYDEVVRVLTASPDAFVHGEHYPSNVLVKPGVRVCPIDWEMAGVGPAVLDLAALSSAWADEERQRIVAAYRSELRLPPPTDELARALDAALLHFAMQWLGWAPDWTPPEEHAHDWLDEALQAAERLEL